MMDLEELKNAWASVNERLGKQELLKENIIREMIRDKSNRLLRKLLNSEIFGLAICLFSIPAMVFLLYIEHFRVHTQWGGKVFVWTMIVICTVKVIWGLIKIAKLLKVDFTKSVRSNSLLISRYNIWTKKEGIVAIVLIPILYFLGIWMYVLLHANAALWTFLVCALLSGIFMSIYTYKIYVRNIDAIRQNLRDLKEMEEDEDENRTDMFRQ
jgi:hypothetical protein